MQNLIYVIARTLPFWAIPLGITLLLGAIQGKKSGVKGARIYAAMFGSLFLLGGSVVYLVLQGHQTAVPLVHEIMNTPVVDVGD